MLQTNEVQVRYDNNVARVIVGTGIFAEQMSFNTFFYSSQFGGYQSTTNYDSIKTNASTRYVFGQVQLHNKNEKLRLGLGGRLSHHSLFGNYGTFEVNPSVALSKSSLVYASISSGFNAPSLYQLFDPTQDFGSFTHRGNRALNPEKSLSMEIGIKKEFTGGSYFTASVFNTRIESAIEYVYLWNKNTAVISLSYLDYLGDTYINIAQQNINGMELAGNLNVSKKLSLNGNFTYLTGNLKFSPGDVDVTKTGGNHVQIYSNGGFLDQAIERKSLVRRPKATAFAEARYLIVPGVTFTADFRLAGSRFDSAYDPTLGPYGALNQSNVKSYQLVDAGIHWQINKALSVSARLENIFNQKYREIIGYNTRGTSGYVKLNVRF